MSPLKLFQQLSQLFQEQYLDNLTDFKFHTNESKPKNRYWYAGANY